MAELAGNAHISFEGDLSHSRFIDDLVLTRDETPMLKRNTLAPTHDFIVLRLANETIEPIFRQIQAARLKRAILHVEIRLSETLCCNWAPYDTFRDGCVVTGPRVGPASRDELLTTKVLREFKIAVPRKRQT